jgi:hypothetical protein
LAGTGMAALASVVYEQHGDVVAALKLPKRREQRSDFIRRVLVDPMQADEGIEDEQARTQAGHGVPQGSPVAFDVEPYDRSGDDVDR